jgi:3-deoxy-manno-octulosonate cytidylyltransferase (CMP-KDO synthetase)
VHPDRTAAGFAPPRIVGAIPARYGSTRLAAKALVELAGRPMVEHVYRRAAAADGLERVVVLTDDERIAEVVRGFGGDVELTPVDCTSGTDRIAWAARRWSCDGVVNIQGDEPLIDPKGIERVARHLREHADDPIVTLAADAEPGDADDPGVVKVVLDRAGYALYFSRAAIPWARDDFARGIKRVPRNLPAYRHLGIYAYRVAFLRAFTRLAPAAIERFEALEQLRALAHGHRIHCAITRSTPHPGVDTPEDLGRILRRGR